MATNRHQKLAIGQSVKIVIDPPNGVPIEGIIRIIQETPGKKVGIELDHFTDYAHSLDGQVEQKTDPVRRITVGKGWWTLEENLEIL
ncbi:TPA: hypothetical protein DIV55_04465 [Patescibacteria group bacterium]|uniref:Uncharacterized protein n=1 Tax=Candidatus Gottesmanbacteria bacterium GW2011_GWA1_43_11 TaxID=1618436 RepID=A0A0G1EMY1_9BACT|nr:MAG: hypothetical protein UV59_C0020G0030 [Candidatus Gottesmanbacteria bacterium GW2011_GWA1_43_11]HCS78967.1 hypothetical protein [Patescibacteria group bacterium]